jgi:hypothetical protein
MERIDGKVVRTNGPVELLTPESTGVPLFTQMLTKIEFGDRKDAPYVVLDARGLMRSTRNPGDSTFPIRDHSEYDFQMSRAKLQVLWQDEYFPRLDILRAGDLVPITFTNWISRTLASNRNLDPEQQRNATVVCAYYYANLFYTATEFDDRERLKTVQQIARWTRIPATDVMNLVDQLPYMPDLESFVAGLKKVVQTPRIEQIDRSFLYNLLGNGWFGQHAKETVCVSLEHPPTFTALVLGGLQLRSYQKATISKIAVNAVRGGNDKELIKNLTFLTKDLSDL